MLHKTRWLLKRLKKVNIQPQMMVELYFSSSSIYIALQIEKILGFSNLVKEIIAARKPLIGHNLIYDLYYIIELFVQPLPITYQGMRDLLQKLFPSIIDTKTVAIDVQNFYRIDTSLQSLHKYCFNGDKILSPFCHVALEEGKPFAVTFS